MKRILLTVSAVFLALSWICEADAGNLGPISCGSASCLFVGSDGKIYNQDGGLYASTTGAVLVANPDNTQYYWATGSTAPLNFNNLGTGLDVSGNYNAQYWVKENGDVAWGPTYAPNSLVMAGANAILADGGASPGGSMENAFIIRSDGTSNVCSGSNNVEIINISNDWAGYWMCRKSDGTLETNYPGFNAAGMTFKHISGSRYGSTAWCGNKTDDTMHCQGVTAPSGTYRDVSVKGTDRYCAARVSDSAFTCWNGSATVLVQTGSTANPNPPAPEPTAGPAKSICRNVTIPNTSATSWIDPGFFSIPSSTDVFRWTEGTSPIPSSCSNLITSNWAGSPQCGDVGTLAQMDSSGNMDRVTVYNYYTGSVLVPNSFTASGTSRSLLIRDENVGIPVMKFGAMRDGVPYAANVWQFFGVQNPSSSRNWAYEIGADGSSTPIYATGGQATIVYANGRSSVVLQLNETAVAPKGMRIGTASGSVTKTQCENATTACEWTRATFDGEFACTPILKRGAYGQCVVVSGMCAPSATGSLTPSDNATITYGPNGEIVDISAPEPQKNPDGTIRSADVFSCPKTPSGFSNWINCLLEVSTNVWDLLSSNTTNLTGEGTGSVIGVANKLGTTSGELSFTGVSPDGVNLADTVFRGTWNESFVGTEGSPFRGFGTFALVGAVILLIIGSIGAIALAASKR